MSQQPSQPLKMTVEEFRYGINSPVWIQDHLSRIIFYPKTEGQNIPGNPHSPITTLIQGIYEYDPQNARARLRAPLIYDPDRTTIQERDKGMIKVAAKRTRTVDMHPPLDPATQIQAVEIDFINRWSFKNSQGLFSISGAIGEKLTLDFAIRRLRAHSEYPPGDKPRALRSRPEAAVLLSKESEVLAWAVNTNHPNRTLHAEVNLIQSWWRETRRPLPRNSTLVTTLKPCKMCAGMILDAAEDPSLLDVIYDRFDPGPHGRETILNGRQYFDCRENL